MIINKLNIYNFLGAIKLTGRRHLDLAELLIVVLL
jgi:hypothetical protein